MVSKNDLIKLKIHFHLLSNGELPEMVKKHDNESNQYLLELGEFFAEFGEEFVRIILEIEIEILNKRRERLWKYAIQEGFVK